MTPDFDMLRRRLQAAWARQIKAGTHCRSCVTPLLDGKKAGRPRDCHICKHITAIEAAEAAIENKLKAGVCPACGKKLKTEQGARDHYKAAHSWADSFDAEVVF